MPRLTRPPFRRARRAEERTVDDIVGACRDPDTLLAVLEAIGRALERVAHHDTEQPMKGVIQDMANAVRRAGKDASRLWRDARG